MRCRWGLYVLAAGGMLIHFGTALLRLGMFYPFPRLVDFSGFYASASALRLGMSPYDLSEQFLERLQAESAIPFRPPPIYNPPIWPWVLQPLTFLSFGPAAVVWVMINLALIAWAATALARTAGYEQWRIKGLVFLLVLSFGPVFLDLTLGQTSVILLALSLVVGQGLRSEAKRSVAWSSLAAAIAVGVKLFPLVWLGAVVLLRRWRRLFLGILMTCLIFGVGLLITPQGNLDYWSRFLPQRVMSSSDRGDLDDQSLAAWLDRMGRPQTYLVPSLRAEERTAVTWKTPWSMELAASRWAAYALAALLGLPVAVVLLRTRSTHREGGFYLWVLYTLLVFPHVERYNHALLLPALAWLWRRGRWQRTIVALAYFVTGLSRLNHLWAIVLPAPWAPLASGFGLYAVLVLGTSMVVTICKVSRPALGKIR